MLAPKGTKASGQKQEALSGHKNEDVNIGAPPCYPTRV